MGDFDRPMPIPTPTTQPFWDALAEHKIRIQYSPSTQRYVFYPPRVLAPGTLADDLQWREISGAASLYTFTVAYRPVAPHFADNLPSYWRSCNGMRDRGSPPRSSTPNRRTSKWGGCAWRRCFSTIPMPASRCCATSRPESYPTLASSAASWTA